MKLNEVEVGSKLSLTLAVNDEIVQLTSRVAVVLPDSVLVEPIIRDEKTIGLDAYDVQVIYAASDEKPVVWLKTKVILVKYKNELYHQIIAAEPGQVFNRRGDYRQFVGGHGSAVISGALHDVIIKNISLNGIAFIADREITTGGSIKIRFQDMDYDFNLTVLICWHANEEDSSRYIYGCKIITKNIKIETYISEKQRISMQGKLASSSEKRMRAAKEPNSREPLADENREEL